MRNFLIPGIAVVLAVAVSCKTETAKPRPTIPLVYSILSDTTGTASLVSMAGKQGADGSIAIIGEPQEAIGLARRFQYADRVDNISGVASRDSLPDFAGESFDVVMDAFHAPYGALVGSPDGVDSLREAAVAAAVFAWDSTCYRSATDARPILPKKRAKILIFTSSIQAKYGLFDVDTLQQLSGGKSILLSPVPLMLKAAFESGARNIAVWTSPAGAASLAWESAFEEIGQADASLSVLVPEKALDVRTELRDVLRQYRASGKSLDLLLLDSYSISTAPLRSELSHIRFAGTEEDRILDNLLSPSFGFLEPVSTLLEATYGLLRGNHLFTHRIARPAVFFYETEASDTSDPILVEAAESYVQRAYVSDNN